MDVFPISEIKPENPAPPIQNFDKVAELAQDAKAAEANSAGFMKPGQKEKRGRGRPPKMDPNKQKADALNTGLGTPGQSQNAGPQAAPQPPPIPTRKIVEPFVKLASKMGENFAGHPKAAMTSDEMNAIAESLGLVVDKWMPMMAGAYGPELFLCVAIGSWGARVGAIRKVIQEEMAQKDVTPKENPEKEPGPAPSPFHVVQETVPEHTVPNGKIKRPNMDGIDLSFVEAEFGPVQPN